MTNKKIHNSFTTLKQYCEDAEFKGYDPYDGLNSTLFQSFPFIKNSRLFIRSRTEQIERTQGSIITFAFSQGHHALFNQVSVELLPLDFIGWYPHYGLTFRFSWSAVYDATLGPVKFPASFGLIPTDSSATGLIALPERTFFML